MTTEQKAFIRFNEAAIRRALEANDVRYLHRIARTIRYQRLFGAIPVKEAWESYQKLTQKGE